MNKPRLLILFIIFDFFIFFLFNRLFSKNFLYGFLISEFFFILLPALFFIKSLPIKINIVFPSLIQFLQIFLFLITNFIVLFIIFRLIMIFFPNYSILYTEYSKFIKSLNYSPVSLIIIFALFPAIIEELFFRGVIINILDNEKGLPAILVSSFVFAIFHQSPEFFLQIFISGIFLGYLYKISGNFFSPVLFHFVSNLIALQIF